MAEKSKFKTLCSSKYKSDDDRFFLISTFILMLGKDIEIKLYDKRNLTLSSLPFQANSHVLSIQSEKLVLHSRY
ncbi:hypothetical protein K7X08_010388 [Anisodus acutangulus]|uniref:Uncharacterized protein n=1 Tax=Anisodus acutangulus TaxID=402998 RepID=A0A9Q1RUG2_9SOLA|nr:hypothetical protein K7X08_010388 [Anisodus acutangulus]